MSEREEARPASSRPGRESLVGPLPAAVRGRVVGLATDALGRIPADRLPGPLRRVASFTPSRRARLAGSQVASALEADEAFRDLVAADVRQAAPELTAAVDAGDVPAAADPVEVAALAYLLRPSGWPGLVEAAADAAEADRATSELRKAGEDLERARRQADALAEELKETRQRQREQLAGLKQENSDLRHKLGDTRARLKAAQHAAAEAEAAAGEAAAAATTAAGAADAEVRRLRSRVEELEQEVATLRRSDRADRDSETLRARLLLDALLDSAQGLRRELALPPVEGAPADRVEAHEAEHGRRPHSGHASLGPDDPALLDQLLALPRAHMIVDGYNVTKSAWPDLSLEKQRDRLLGGLAPLVARCGAEVTVVFDAAETRERPVVAKPRGVRVLFTRHGVIADDVIRDLVAVEPRGRAVVVVTSDREIVADVLKAGFRAVGAPALGRLMSRG